MNFYVRLFLTLWPAHHPGTVQGSTSISYTEPHEPAYSREFTSSGILKKKGGGSTKSQI